MKENDLDNLERLFKDGLQNLESEPDDAVWQAVQVGVKKSQHFWKFWGIAGIVAIGLVGLMLFQDSDNAQTEPVASNMEQTEIDNNSPTTLSEKSQIQGSNTPKDPAAASSAPSLDDSPVSEIPTNQSPANAEIQNPESPSNPSQNPTQLEKPLQNPTPTNKPIPTPEKKNPNTSVPPSKAIENLVPDDETTPNKKQTPKTQETGPHKTNPTSLLPINKKELDAFECKPEGVSPLAIAGRPITKPGAKSTDEADSSKSSRYFLSFGAGTLIPSIQSKGVEGTTRFTKENMGVFGGSLNLGIGYISPKNWIFRSGVEWSSYSNKGSMKYGKSDTIEWINRERETGMAFHEESYQSDFQLQYQWLSIPLEIGHLYSLTPQFKWEWTAGLGLSYLYNYNAMYTAFPKLETQAEAYKRFQMGMRLGFGINYQLNPQWALMLNTRYQYQAIPVFKDALLTERHQSLAFRLGIQYTLKSKGK